MMKKISSFILPLLFFAVIVSSCNKKNEEVPGEKFSSASVEQNKATVEEAGIELVTTMSDMKSIESVDLIVNLGDILSSSGSEEPFLSKDNKFISTLEVFAAAANGEKKLNDVYDAMISSKELSEDPESIQQAWDENVGTYTWNPELSDWDIELGGDKVIFLFPSSDVSLTNDASATIYNYKGIIIANNPVDEDYTGDLPLSLNADVKVGSKTLISLTFAAKYNTDGVPNSVAADLTIENYKFEVDLTNSTEVISANYKFLADSKVIMDMGASGEGIFTEANYNDNTETVTETNTYSYYDYVYNPVTQQYDQVLVTYTDTWEKTETEFEEILHSANAHFQLFDIAIRGDIDVKGLVDEIRKIEDQRDNETIDSETADELSVVQMNKFVNLRLVNVPTNQIMAKAEAYIKNDLEENETYIDFRLTFNDGSPIDAETYFTNGFDSFIEELNGLIDDLNTEYELELEEVIIE